MRFEGMIEGAIGISLCFFADKEVSKDDRNLQAILPRRAIPKQNLRERGTAFDNLRTKGACLPRSNAIRVWGRGGIVKS
jgi:hypothetical protein